MMADSGVGDSDPTQAAAARGSAAADSESLRLFGHRDGRGFGSDGALEVAQAAL
jgi:hypothetical protein